jgi:hypothetical protein
MAVDTATTAPAGKISGAIGIRAAAFRSGGEEARLPEDALDHADGNPVDLGDLGNGHSVLHPGSDAGMVRPRDLTRGPGLGVGWCRNFLVPDRCPRQDRQNTRFPRGLLGRWHGVRN